MKITLICIFGVLGVLSRHLCDTFIGNKDHIIPLGTFTVNMLGCLLAGYLYSLLVNKNIEQQEVYMAIIIGFCGGLTTFSGYCLQSLNLMQNGEVLRGLTYIVLSPSLGLLFIFLGIKIQQTITHA